MFSTDQRKAWVEMAKPRIVAMVLVTTLLGYVLAGRGDLSLGLALVMLVGTGLAAAGSAVLNNYLERDSDARMARTRHRPLPSGRIEPSAALGGGVLLVLAGVLLMAWAVNLLAGFLVLLTAFLYVVVYTPLKKLHWINTPIGAIPGALPPMIGWATATESLDPGAWILFGILFAWQHPHFYAISWMFQKDYAAAGYKMLSVIDPSGRRVFSHAIFFSMALIAISILLHTAGLAGSVYLFGAVVAGAGLLTTCVFLWNSHSVADARRVLLASVIYLPVMLVLILVDVALQAYA